jgi:hypothetical protein
LKNAGDLYFVFLGESIPKYAISSLELAAKYSGLSITLISNLSLQQEALNSDINLVNTHSFYDDSEFLKISKNLVFNHGFRGGFWLKTLERFFVIEQFMKYKKIHSLLHAELDQLFFGLEDLEAKLRDLTNDGLYLPLHNSEMAIASIIYIRNPESLSSLLEYSQTIYFQNEMRLISSFGNQNPNLVFGLPTLASHINLYNEINSIKILEPSLLGGLFDAAQIGQWVAGNDPRNVSIKKKPMNKYHEEAGPLTLNEAQLSNLFFIFSEEDRSLHIKNKDEDPKRIFNLHIHSKVHTNLLGENPSLSNLFDSVNKLEKISFHGTRNAQIISYCKFMLGYLFEDKSRFKMYLSRVVKLKLGLRNSSEPFISGDSFRKRANLVWENSSPNFQLRDIKPNDVIFCESDCVLELSEKILSNLTSSVTLVLGNSDQNHDDRFQYLSSNPFVKRVFAQNLSIEMNGFTPLPIGLENSWRSHHGNVKDFKRLSNMKRMRKPRIMWTFAIETNTILRGKAAQELSTSTVADRFGRTSSKEHRQLLLSYSFVASPPGNGLDTHRTWEAMYLGCVPILLKSYMADYFESLGLPVWVVDSYQEINPLSEQDLAIKYGGFKQKFNNDAIWFDYWQRQILD